MNDLLVAAAVTAGVLVALSFTLTTLSRVGRPGRWLADRCAAAPGLDLVVATFTWVPWVVAALAVGWLGFVGTFVGQAATLVLWIAGHELIHRDAVDGPRLVKTHNRLVGRLRNQTALWFSMLAVPVFWVVRIGEMLLYPPLRWLLGFPPYRQSEWVNVSRQKFDGLVGHDLIWCLYCDWMTGVYSLGGEMLRNVESFWCPIRFSNPQKCANCRVDFPDIDDGWVPADATMAEVEETMLRQYGKGRREWFGHPARLTVEGRGLKPPAGK